MNMGKLCVSEEKKKSMLHFLSARPHNKEDQPFSTDSAFHCEGKPVSNNLYFYLQESVDLGEIMFSLCYLPTAGRMTLTVIKCRNLKAMDITGSSGEYIAP